MTNLNPNSIPDGGIQYKHISSEATDNIKDAVVDSINSRLVPTVVTPTQVLYHVNGGTPTWMTSFAVQPTSGAVTSEPHILYINTVSGDVFWRGNAILNISNIRSSIGTISNLSVPATNLVDAINTVYNAIGTSSGSGGTTTINDSTILPFDGIKSPATMTPVQERSLGVTPTSIFFNSSKNRFYFYHSGVYYSNCSSVGTAYNKGTQVTDLARTDVLFSYGGKHYIHLLNVGLVTIERIQTYVDDKCLEVRTTAAEEDNLLRNRIDNLELNLRRTDEGIAQLDLAIADNKTTIQNGLNTLNIRINSLAASLNEVRSMISNLQTRVSALEQFNSSQLDARINDIISERIKYLTSESAYNSLTNIEDDVLYVIKDE